MFMLKKVIFITMFSLLFWSIAFASVYKYSTAELNAANSLANQNIINNHSTNPQNYNLWDSVLRQEIAAVARWVAKLDKKDRCDNIFSDLSDTKPNNWACKNVEALVDNDLISRNKTFRPEDNITKSEAIAMLIKAIWFDYNYNPNIDKNWQQQVVEFAANKRVVELFTDYNTPATRGWIFIVADTTIKKDEYIKKYERETWIYSDEAF